MIKRISYIAFTILFLPFQACQRKNMLLMNSIVGTHVQSGYVIIGGQSNAVQMIHSGQGLTELFNRLASAGYQVQGYVECDATGSAITKWATNGAFYQQCVQDVGDKHILFTLWWQGEAETGPDQGDPQNSTNWAQLFTPIGEQLVHDFHAPVFYARLENFNFKNEPYWDVVRSQQEAVHFTGGTMVSLDGLKPDPNDLHYIWTGYGPCEDRFANAFIDSGSNIKELL